MIRDRLQRLFQIPGRSADGAMKNLRNSDMITVDSDGFISLTEAGHKIADTIFERHTVLSNMLIKLGVPAEIAAEDACRMEHVISDESFDKIKMLPR